MNAEIFPLFSTPVYRASIEYDLSTIVEKIKTIEYTPYEFKNGFRSADARILNQEYFRELKSVIEDHLLHYLTKCLMLENRFQLSHVSSWINLHKTYNHSHLHFHTNSMYSGVLYLDVGSKDCGDLIFSNPQQIPTWKTFSVTPELSETTILNAYEYSFEAKNNLLFLFPSHVNHYTEKNKSPHDRYSVVFNYFLDGNYDFDPTARINIKTS
jgi:uncharacterized protein (TIGR02466 family)